MSIAKYAKAGLFFGIAGFGISSHSATLVVSSLFEPNLEDGRVEKVRTDGTDRKALRHTGSGLRGVVVDVAGGNMFWSDVNSGRIEQVKLSNTWDEPTSIFNGGFSFIQNLEYSPATQQLFWVDALHNQVSVSSRDGSNAKVLFSAVSTTISVDSVNQKIYSEDRKNATRGSIVRANLDGSDFEVVISDVPTAADIAVDPMRGYIYWTSTAGLSDGNGGVYRVNLDGSGFTEMFVKGSNLDATGIAVDSETGDVYWAQQTDTNRSDIYRMSTYGDEPEVVSRDYGNVGDMSLVADFTSGPDVIDIDIDPRDERNIIELRARGVWVAVPSDAETTFDPLQVNVDTVRFGPAKAGVTRYKVRDVNFDGIPDLLLHFKTEQTGLSPEDTNATLTGETFLGQLIGGMDLVQVIESR